MPAYHSKIADDGVRNIGRLPILPLKNVSKLGKGAAPAAPADKEDIVDEALLYFKANILFRNFDVTSNSDRLLVYLTLYISAALKKVVKKNKVDAEKLLYAYALENFPLPGDNGFPLGGLVSKPATKQEADQLRAFLTQARQECNTRLVERLYKDNAAEPDKWWMCFSKRKFLNMEM